MAVLKFEYENLEISYNNSVREAQTRHREK